ncbi:MAG: molybdopterin molybdotransferase MoeA [Synergistaceae bacterium]|nr:molybdopterin molybdotransferase MoeA [Synergistaceae bacterium]
MSGFVKKVIPRLETILRVSEALKFPWLDNIKTLELNDSTGERIANSIYSDSSYPSKSRSLRDGFAVQSRDVLSATSATPSFLKKIEEVEMGNSPSFEVGMGEAAPIPTGGILPAGSDTVVMLENTSEISGYVEIRKGVQSGDNIIVAGEDITSGEKVLGRGELINSSTIGIMATLGINSISVFNLSITVLSTGDEVVPVKTCPLPEGKIRDVNSYSIVSILKQHGFDAKYKGIVSDKLEELHRRVKEELSNCDILILSGGSSVGIRDYSFEVLNSLDYPGLITRGINIAPGKPTLIGGSLKNKKLVISLPGHPLSCITVAYVVVLPLLLKLIGAEKETYGHRLNLQLSKDLVATSGVEEFIPCKIDEMGKVIPLLGKSGYISILADSNGFIRIPENRETLRMGDYVEVWLW